MSADNWASCPRCHEKQQTVKAAHEALLHKAYTTMTAFDFDVFKSENPGLADTDTETFREDYELGVTEEGEFYVHYNGQCSKCGLKHSFDHREDL